MALDVTVGGADSDSYQTLAFAWDYAHERGYAGSAGDSDNSPLIKGAVLADATSLILDGLTNGQTVLVGDTFRVAGAPGEYTFTTAGVVDGSGDTPTLDFSPAAPTGGFADDAAVTFLALSDENMRRGADALDEMVRGRVKGLKAASGQALLFPRSSLTDGEGNYVASDTIPQEVKDAQVELALFIPSGLDWQEGFKIKETQAGSVVTEFSTHLWLRQRLDRAEELMRPYLSGLARRIGRGG